MAVDRELEIFVERLKQDFKDIRFRGGAKFMFRPPRTVFYEKKMNWGEAGRLVFDEDGSSTGESGRGASEGGLSQKEVVEYKMQLLHEVGHAVLEHRFFATDLERVKMERAAWDRAEELGRQYGVEFDEEIIEEKLDSYRNWLHQKSSCKGCGLTMYQTKDGEYHCPFCGKS